MVASSSGVVGPGLGARLAALASAAGALVLAAVSFWGSDGLPDDLSETARERIRRWIAFNRWWRRGTGAFFLAGGVLLALRALLLP